MVMFPDIKSAPFVCACGLAGSISISIGIGIGIEKKKYPNMTNRNSPSQGMVT